LQVANRWDAPKKPLHQTVVLFLPSLCGSKPKPYDETDWGRTHVSVFESRRLADFALSTKSLARPQK